MSAIQRSKFDSPWQTQGLWPANSLEARATCLGRTGGISFLTLATSKTSGRSCLARVPRNEFLVRIVGCNAGIEARVKSSSTAMFSRNPCGRIVGIHIPRARTGRLERLLVPRVEPRLIVRCEKRGSKFLLPVRGVVACLRLGMG